MYLLVRISAGVNGGKETAVVVRGVNYFFISSCIFNISNFICIILLCCTFLLFFLFF